MTKYREHTQSKILNTKVNFVEAFSKHQQFNEQKDEVIRQQTQKIQEMAAVMQRASKLDEEKLNQEQEYLSKLITENKGLRELLEISHKYGSNGQKILVDDKSTQTDTYLLDALTAASSSKSGGTSSFNESSSASNTGTIKVSPSSLKAQAAASSSSTSPPTTAAPAPSGVASSTASTLS